MEFSQKRFSSHWIDNWWMRVAFAIGILFLQSATARALPVYSRQYGVGCQTCHTVAPRLNQFGYAFQANYFNWPTREGPPKRDPTHYLPVSTLTTFSYQNDFTNKQETVNVRAFEVYSYQRVQQPEQSARTRRGLLRECPPRFHFRRCQTGRSGRCVYCPALCGQAGPGCAFTRTGDALTLSVQSQQQPCGSDSLCAG